MAQNAAERRHKATQPRHETLVESRQEGPSRPKGKNTDLCKWGDVHLDEHEMDVDTQQAAYESYKEQSQYADRHKRQGRHHRPNVGRELSQRQTRPLESRPVAQIAPDSFLGGISRNKVITPPRILRQAVRQVMMTLMMARAMLQQVALRPGRVTHIDKKEPGPSVERIRVI